MAFTFQELKTAKQNIMDSFGIDPAAAARVIGHYNKYPDKIAAMIAGDMSGVNLAALGIAPTKGPAAAPAASDLAADLVKGAAADPDVKPAADLATMEDKTPAAAPQRLPDIASDNRPDNAPSKPHNAQKTIIDTLPPAQALPATSPAADPENIIDSDYSDLLPPGLYDDICDIITNFCKKNNIPDRMKIHPQQWQAACYDVGWMIKKRGLLNDVEKLRTHGGRHYNPHAVLALLRLYEYTCSSFKQTAFSHNFPRFAGVSDEYFKDYMQRGLSSTQVGLAQKAAEIQRASIVGAISGGGSATVGNIFLGKALAGLQESTTIVHVSAGPSVGLSDLPRLASSGDNLPG